MPGGHWVKQSTFNVLGKVFDLGRVCAKAARILTLPPRRQGR